MSQLDTDTDDREPPSRRSGQSLRAQLGIVLFIALTAGLTVGWIGLLGYGVYRAVRWLLG